MMRDMNLRAFIQRLNQSSVIQSKARECRQLVNVPEFGFESKKEFDKWLEATDFDVFTENFNSFIESVIELVPYQTFLTTTGFIQIMTDLYYMGSASEEGYERLADDLYDIGLIIGDGRKGFKKNKELGEGVFLRIPVAAEKTQVQGYLDKHWESIQKLQNEFLERKEYQKHDIQHSTNIFRDLRVVVALRTPMKKLEEISGLQREGGNPKESKESYVSRIMKEKYGLEVSPSTVESIKKTWKNRESWVREE